MLLATIPATAEEYIDICACDAGEEEAVRLLWHDSGAVWIGVWGDVEFTIIVTESNPNDVDTCWIYLNGTTTTAMSRDFTATDYRLLAATICRKTRRLRT